ncbi:hypothetical protein KFL_006870020 [Klebsormidium nitens]|uniref:Uncharacterized protein n=1 Tax=Klebsormidium nitens TaxID=105231 RepID=A0A1Y1INP7_KLENI|nr:hypothetical protein KFL_006870020 [Klebsormidium nitens]|eukprot:GAQ90801.1 hypothetical protein KFL_006870020 [Klebsormidium nitens]
MELMRDAVREPPMARDFFRNASRDVSPQYRWARRSRRSTSSGDREPEASSFRDFAQRPSPPGSPAPAPQVLNRTSSRSKRVEAGAAAPLVPAPASLDRGSVKSGPGRAVGGKPDGAASPRGPLDFPASPVSSPGSVKDAASPAARLTPVRSRRSPSPQQALPGQAPWVPAGSPVAAAGGPRPSSSSRRGGMGQAGAQGSSPPLVGPAAPAARQEAGQAPPKTLVAHEATARSSPALRAGGQGPNRVAGNTAEAAGERAAKPEARGAGRSSTPFRRGLNAIKGRFFSDSRKAASVEISKTQQDLLAQHKVKPAASSGIKESLVHRLTRALQRPGQPARSRFLPAPPAAPLEPPAAPMTAVASPPRASMPRLLEPPKALAARTAPSEEPEQPCAEGHRLEEARVGTAGTMGGAGQGSEVEGPHGNNDQEARVGDRSVESAPCPVRSLDVVAEAGAEGGGGATEGLPPGSQAGPGDVQSSSPKAEMSSANDSNTDSDSDSERTRARFLPRTRSAGAPASQARYASWAQHIPPAVSPAASWDSQSSTEFANTRRPSLAQRLVNSESSGSEQGSPRYARSPLGSPPGAAFGGRPASQPPVTEKFSLPATACPSVVSPEGPLPAASLSSPHQAPASPAPHAAVRRSLDPLGWSSDEDAEEDRGARKREMAAALRQLKSFQSGGTTPHPAQAPLQRSLTDPAAFQVVKRSASPMRTLWRQATAAATSLEGPASSAKRLGLSAAGRALGRSRDPSPCPPGLLASPRRLRPEASPQRVPQGSSSLFEDGPRRQESWGTGLRGAAGAAGAAGRASKTPSRGRPIAAAAAFFRSFTPGRQRAQVF